MKHKYSLIALVALVVFSSGVPAALAKENGAKLKAEVRAEIAKREWKGLGLKLGAWKHFGASSTIATSTATSTAPFMRERFLSAAARIQFIADRMTEFGAKLQARIDAAAAAGKDVSAAVSAMTDFNAELSSARAHAQAAVTLVTPLTATSTAFMEARTHLRAGMADLKDTRQDVRTVFKALKDKKGK